ncbi:MAG: DUF4270 family protein [Bacteroidales bacterium]|nr:DUF4270 family protein [Bacteroidales bacterium]MBQ8959528.1 DUF4270 family protein [Bacteroidales bacterium]
MIGLLVLAFASCRKSPDTIGNNLISDDNYFEVYKTDTAEVICYSYLDTVSTGNVLNGLLGSMNDPVFGHSEAGFYTQFRPSVAGQSYGSNPVLDSLVLQLSLTNYYGDTTVMQTVHAFELSDTLSVLSTYYNTSEVATYNVDHANGYQFRPRPNTKMHIYGTDTVRQAVIRIPLSQELGNYLMSLDTTVYSRPDLFKQHFKGLHVFCDPVSYPGSIISIDVTNNTYTLLQLYYHNAATPEKPMRYDFHTTSKDAYFNSVEHDYSSGSQDFVSQVLEGQTDLGKQLVYLQSMGGVKTKILFPNLEHWTDSLENCHLVINEAKLIVPASASATDSVYKAPTNFFLLGFNADSSTYLLPDYYEGSGYFGGTYNPKNQTVIFRISEYMQRVIMGKKDNYGLSLGINGAAYNANRMVINGPEATTTEKLRLEVIYSIVND